MQINLQNEPGTNCKKERISEYMRKRPRKFDEIFEIPVELSTNGRKRTITGYG